MGAGSCIFYLFSHHSLNNRWLYATREADVNLCFLAPWIESSAGSYIIYLILMNGFLYIHRGQTSRCLVHKAKTQTCEFSTAERGTQGHVLAVTCPMFSTTGSGWTASQKTLSQPDVLELLLKSQILTFVVLFLLFGWIYPRSHLVSLSLNLIKAKFSFSFFF